MSCGDLPGSASVTCGVRTGMEGEPGYRDGLGKVSLLMTGLASGSTEIVIPPLEAAWLVEVSDSKNSWSDEFEVLADCFCRDSKRKEI